MPQRLKVLILGGYGTFGGRLARLLADEDRLTLIIAGRSRGQAIAFCAAMSARAECLPVTFDRNGDVLAQLRALHPDMVVDASGPFQAYGDDPYRVVRAALTLGVDYLDLADASGFVKGIRQFDAEARTRGVVILSGVSSFPVLTAAVVRKLATGLARIETVTGGIAPSPYAGVGLNVIRAIASYAGQPVRDGDGRLVGHGMVDGPTYTIAPPGQVPLNPIRFSLVDVPDLQVLPELWPSLRSVWMGAGPVPPVLHRALNALAWLVSKRWLPRLEPLAPIMYRAINILRWGEHRGGMFVSVAGLGEDGNPAERSWHMIAEGDDGPLIPSMAAEAIICKCLADERPAPGARPATADLELSDYDVLFARRAIVSGCRGRTPADATAPLYRRMLDEALDRLPAPLRAMHNLTSDLTAKGRAQVERGDGLLARLAARVIGFPPAGSDVPLTVSFRADQGREIWQRDFGGRIFVSTQEAGQKRWAGLLCERFGPFSFGLALVVDGDKIRLIPRRWSAFGLALPLAWAPGGEAHESVEDGRFRFHVEIRHPLAGLIVRYRGWLVPSD